MMSQFVAMSGHKSTFLDMAIRVVKLKFVTNNGESDVYVEAYQVSRS
jgi:hypothetical protein